jgi:hypothetical protein
MKENREKSRVKQSAYVGKQIVIAGSCSSVLGGARVTASTNGSRVQRPGVVCLLLIVAVVRAVFAVYYELVRDHRTETMVWVCKEVGV